MLNPNGTRHDNPRPAQGQARRRPCRLAHPPRRLPPLSLHARRRAKQRDISAEAIRAAFDHGTRAIKNNAYYFQLRDKDVVRVGLPDMVRWIGTTVVVSMDHRTVVTVFNVLAAHAA